MRRKFATVLTCLTMSAPLAYSQQFVGAYSSKHTCVGMMPYNPAWAAMAEDGPQLQLIGGSALAGTNAFWFEKKFVTDGFPGGARENKDYFPSNVSKERHMWGNIDVFGPSAAFHIKGKVYGGFYTRVREIVHGGNVNQDAFRFLGEQRYANYGARVNFEKAGFTHQTFTEIGFTAAKLLRNDFYNVIRGGVTLKYVTGLSAGTVYTNKASLVQDQRRHIDTLEGDLTAVYSRTSRPFVDNDFKNDPSHWFDRSGKGGIALDLGIQYEFHPAGDPNYETPYLFSFSASLTDLGSVRYLADTGSGVYDMKVYDKLWWQYERNPYEPTGNYLGRMVNDSLLRRKEEIKEFRIGLPTALRLNLDYNFGGGWYINVATLLNMKGSNGSVFRPGYVSMFNFTPRHETRKFMIALPVTVLGRQTTLFGLSLRMGSVSLGSSSLLSTLATKQVKNLDAYAALAFKLEKRQRVRYY